MKTKHRYTFNLQFFAEEVPEPTGVEDAPAAEVQEPEVPAPETGENQEAAAEPEKQNNFEKAFAKRLSDAQAKWEAEKQAEIEKLKDEYKDFDTYKKATDFLMKSNNISDPMTLKEQLELTELQERADKEQVSPEVLKRIDVLEAKAAKADEYERQQAEQAQLSEFENSLKEFAKDKEVDGKPVDHMELWTYMHENGISKPESALKAMKADILEQKLQEKETEVINRYLKSKTDAPKVESGGVAGMQTWKPTGNIDAATERAAARIRAANNPS